MPYSIISKRGLSAPFDLCKEFSSQLGISILAAKLAISRGIDTIDAAERFFRPNESLLNDPFLLDGMQAAKEAIYSSIARSEKIVVVGDYDCDGVCGAVILKKALDKLGADCATLLPDRFVDGYGINTRIISKAFEYGAKLIITVDNGISAFEAAEKAKELGIKLIVTDHHLPPEALPYAEAIINPLLLESAYPYKWLCGSGVSLKLAFALCPEFTKSEKNELLALCAVATIADCVELTGENRAIASLGLKYVADGLNIGLKALAEVAHSGSSEVSSSFVSFQIAPRINASGRMSQPYAALSLLEEGNPENALEMAKVLNAFNSSRQEEEESLLAQAEQYIKSNELETSERIFFILIPNAHEGVIGIVAGKIAERFHRPAAIMCISGQVIKGSVRSVPGIDVFSILKASEGYFITFGGHAQAAGFTINEANLESAARMANKAAEEAGLPLATPESFAYDIEASLSQITRGSVAEIEAMAPFGIGNPKPAVLIENCIIQNAKSIGQTGEHIRCDIVENGSMIKAIGFSMAREVLSLPKGAYVDIVASPSLHTYKNDEYLQLELKAVLRHIDCPTEYWLSLYRHFKGNIGSINWFAPQTSKFHTIETALGLWSRDKPLYILYGRDTLLRCLRLCSSIGVKANVHYGCLGNIDAGSVNILVNPIQGDSLLGVFQKAYVLDQPCFYGYEEWLLKDIRDVEFLETPQWHPQASINRSSIALIYKCLSALSALGGNAEKFVDFLNTMPGEKADLFTLLVSLDIMKELGFLNYSHEGVIIKAEIAEKQVQKSLDSSYTMQEIKKRDYQMQTENA